MIPLPPSVGKKPDKLTVLKFAVQHMKVLKGTFARQFGVIFSCYTVTKTVRIRWG